MLLNDITDDEAKAKLKSITSGYNFTDDLPKDGAFINLNDSISDDRRAFITNGLRSFFKDDLTMLVDRKTLHDSVESNL